MVKALTTLNLFDQVKRYGADLENALRTQFAQYENIGDFSGHGLLGGIELVADHATKSRLDPSLATSKKQNSGF